ncbi:hypothetical protein H112_02205 [Trichophyton rubrum D6]|uniref:Uncharacterized protein n=2 Tax=Trichophyton TaxID=5550 RepID=A0A022WAT6_TRIRU|nr:hypothetical protein H100_02205 [Trichophyton rubrum MR850]EZF44515.1 hypothetical protein H102_02201 [Trichophyton rubrum CBS 100081]EZF55153.1 hypothetical protein H103_02210 [Trichophyton rubrum CBS 288.86]EZF65771.1 hypothetical protein H104_02186 [Trichophyton rubrum CBS 289.86]EZF76400.1 hypothetical protein H105_02222 [Trichophyton soudanense CBS 452.61]EZF87079.1 hypothetical protein H110_02207 [Trichophyton rubrum MR1448]EZF97875.1 hypothetical protein H113_02211 [Trichophyton rub
MRLVATSSDVVSTGKCCMSIRSTTGRRMLITTAGSRAHESHRRLWKEDERTRRRLLRPLCMAFLLLTNQN